MYNKKPAPSESWDNIRKKLNISPEQEAEIQLELDIINATIEARKKNKLTQTELAEKTGLKQSVIARFEKNRNSPRIDTTIKMLLPMGYTLRVVPVDKNKVMVQWNYIIIRGENISRPYIFVFFSDNIVFCIVIIYN